MLKMATFTGILLDVSGSMKQSANLDDVESDRPTSWVKSIFTVLDNLLQHDVSHDNCVFAAAFGGQDKPEVFDVLKAIKVSEENDKLPDFGNNWDDLSNEEIAKKILLKLESNGANRVRNWTDEIQVGRLMKHHQLEKILKKILQKRQCIEKIVNCLPEACKDSHYRQMARHVKDFRPWSGNFWSSVWGILRAASQKTVSKVIRKAKDNEIDEVKVKAMIALNIFCQVDRASIHDVHQASKIVRSSLGEGELTKTRVEKLMKSIEPFIYGRTPLYSAVEQSIRLMDTSDLSGHHKLLFILSDGQANDHGDICDVEQDLRRRELTVVTCYINPSHNNTEFKKLFSTEQRTWDKAAKIMFRLSSSLPTDRLVTYGILVKYGWEIDFENNETKLFMQINHPDLIKKASKTAKKIICTQDALLDVLGFIDFDMYINKTNEDFKAQEKQKSKTCYAHASAVVLHLALNRVKGRGGECPTFQKLKNNFVSSYGTEGYSTLKLLEKECSKYRLKCKPFLRVEDAMKAIIGKRPVVAKFKLTNKEWAVLKEFFKNRSNRKTILTTNEIDITKRHSSEKAVNGHAVVLVGYNSECLRLMNSWGRDWGDDGFFRIKNAEVLDLKFIDVFEKGEDKQKIKSHGTRAAKEVMKNLRGLHTSDYRCPKCGKSSLVTEYFGTLKNVQCPKCDHFFEVKDQGNVLALNLYLTSILDDGLNVKAVSKSGGLNFKAVIKSVSCRLFSNIRFQKSLWLILVALLVVPAVLLTILLHFKLCNF